MTHAANQYRPPCALASPRPMTHAADELQAVVPGPADLPDTMPHDARSQSIQAVVRVARPCALLIAFNKQQMVRTAVARASKPPPTSGSSSIRALRRVALVVSRAASRPSLATPCMRQLILHLRRTGRITCALLAHVRCWLAWVFGARLPTCALLACVSCRLAKVLASGALLLMARPRLLLGSRQALVDLGPLRPQRHTHLKLRAGLMPVVAMGGCLSTLSRLTPRQQRRP